MERSARWAKLTEALDSQSRWWARARGRPVSSEREAVAPVLANSQAGTYLGEALIGATRYLQYKWCTVVPRGPLVVQPVQYCTVAIQYCTSTVYTYTRRTRAKVLYKVAILYSVQ